MNCARARSRAAILAVADARPAGAASPTSASSSSACSCSSNNAGVAQRTAPGGCRRAQRVVRVIRDSATATPPPTAWRIRHHRRSSAQPVGAIDRRPGLGMTIASSASLPLPSGALDRHRLRRSAAGAYSENDVSLAKFLSMRVTRCLPASALIEKASSAPGPSIIRVDARALPRSWRSQQLGWRRVVRPEHPFLDRLAQRVQLVIQRLTAAVRVKVLK